MYLMKFRAIIENITLDDLSHASLRTRITVQNIIYMFKDMLINIKHIRIVGKKMQNNWKFKNIHYYKIVSVLFCNIDRTFL